MNSDQFDAWLEDAGRAPLVMGVLNLTPDSFSDGGRFLEAGAALEAARGMVEAGAGIIDIGGESTRPGAQAVPAGEQVRRVVPVLREVARALPGVLLSIDTTRAAVASAAIDAGAGMVNDVSAGRDDSAMFQLCADRGVAMVLMHMRGTPRTMQDNPVYADVVGEVLGFLRERREAAVLAGVAEKRILLDPGIGFGKTAGQNLALLGAMRRFAGAGSPVVVGPSRKSFIERVTGEGLESGRVFGTAAAVAWSVANGAAVVRVHDVGPMAKVVRMVRAIGEDGESGR